MLWQISWSRPINDIDVETTANVEADSATDAVKKFIFMMQDIDWKDQILRAEKNNTFFLFIVESSRNNSWFGIKLRRV